MRLSFPPEDDDVYILLKGQTAPSKFVAAAVRYFNAHKNDPDAPSLDSEVIKEDLLNELLKVFGVKFSSLENSLRKEISNELVKAPHTSVQEGPSVQEKELPAALKKAAMQFEID